MKKIVAAAFFALALAAGPAGAQIYVRIGPPRPIVERRPPPPGPRYVWVGGYHRWDGARYVWVRGSYMLPPRAHAHWVPGHWVQRPRGWVWREGHWR